MLRLGPRDGWETQSGRRLANGPDHSSAGITPLGGTGASGGRVLEMTEGAATPDGAESHRGSSFWPQSLMGRWAAVLTVLIFPTAWVLMSHAISWPILDTWVAPAFITILIDAAAATGLLALIRVKDRSILVIGAAVIAVPLAIFATVFLGLHAIAPD